MVEAVENENRSLGNAFPIFTSGRRLRCGAEIDKLMSARVRERS